MNEWVSEQDIIRENGDVSRRMTETQKRVT